jgi:malate dehydrogenase (oxaloacetate-decarboxylating)
VAAPLYQVAVLGDAAVASDADVRVYAAHIQDLSGAATRATLLDGDGIQAALRALPDDVGAVVLPHPVPELDAARLPHDYGVPILTGRDMSAIALSAAVLTTLTRAGRAPRTSRVLVAGANTMPLLQPLLVAGGVGDITIWNMKDALGFPLRRLIPEAHAVVDLLGITVSSDTDTPGMVSPQAHDPLLVVPGLLRALLGTPDARLDVPVCHACALALVMATPPGERLPARPDRALTDRVADAATREMRHPTPHPYDFGSGRPAR